MARDRIFFALFLLILYGAFLILTLFLAAITWALILAILVFPLYTWLIRLLRGRAALAAIIIVALIALLVVVPGVELVWFLSDEAVELVQSVRSHLSDEGAAAWTAKPWVQQILSWWHLLSFRLMDFKINWKELTVQAAQSSSSILVGQVKGLAQNVLLFTVNFVIVLVTVFFCSAMVPNSLPGCGGSYRWTANIKNGCFKISSTL